MSDTDANTFEAVLKQTVANMRFADVALMQEAIQLVYDAMAKKNKQYLQQVLNIERKDRARELEDQRTYFEARLAENTDLILQAIQNLPTGDIRVTEIAERVARLEGMAMGRYQLLQEQKEGDFVSGNQFDREATVEGLRNVTPDTKSRYKKPIQTPDTKAETEEVILQELEVLKEYKRTHRKCTFATIQRDLGWSHSKVQRRMNRLKKLKGE